MLNEKRARVMLEYLAENDGACCATCPARVFCDEHKELPCPESIMNYVEESEEK